MRLTDLKKFFTLTVFTMATAALVLVGCKDDENMTPEVPTGSLTVSDQILINDMINIDNVTLSQSGWVVVHASNAAGDGPQVPEIISNPVLVAAGSNDDVMVTLTDTDGLNDGSQVWVMLHTDDGVMGTYEFDGANGFDGPILDANEAIVVKPLTLTIEAGAPTGMVTVADQTISQNMIEVGSVNMSQNGWIVVHASNAAGDGPQVPEIISVPYLVEAGAATDVQVSLADGVSLSSGDQLWVMLHTDNGVAGEYEFDGANGFDGPILDGSGNIVMKSIIVTAPSITANNQVVSENMVVIEEVNAAVDGWMVIHADNGEGAPGPVLGQTFVEAGFNADVMVDLGDATFAGGELLFPMLHIESPVDGEYGFPENGDGPEVFGSDVVVVSFETSAPTGSIVVSDQAIDANTLTVDNLTVDATAWVVVHADDGNGGPVVPGIISTPVAVQSGSNNDVKITLTENVAAGATLHVMLHTENGTIGTYEFDGTNGFDAPIITETMVASEKTGSITISDQIIQGNTIMASNLTVNAAAWVVVHADDGSGGPVVPGIISTPVQLQAGSNDNVAITLTEAVASDATLYVMLHTEDGTIGEYEFDGVNGFDGPITTESITALAPTGTFTANDQEVSGTTLNVASITVGQPSWVVVHRDDGTGNSFEAPGIISEPVALAAGTATDISVNLTESVTDGERLWIMLHNDNGTVGTYEFDGANGFDNPITFSSIDVTVTATINFNVTNNGATDYIFNGNGLTDAADPAITLTRGETYTFTINASGHPFYINSTQGTGTANAYNDGVTNNGTQSGTITFTVPANAPGTLFYNCEFHSGMTGTITVID